MRIRHFNHSDLRGGAARAAWRLSEALRRAGADSRMVVRDRKGDSDRALLIEPATLLGGDEAKKELLHLAQDRGLTRGRTVLSNTLFSLGAPGIDVTSVQEVIDADVIHLHWTSFFLSPQTIARLGSIGLPVVWTLHDQWAFTGGCHYSAGCSAYEDECAACPQLVPSSRGIARLMLREKRQTYGTLDGLTIIAPSAWMAECVRKSAVLSEKRIEVLPNGVDTDLFRPTDRARSRSDLSLPQDAFILLFGVEYGAEKRKGFDVIAHALKQLKSKSADFNSLHLAYFGKSAAGIDELGFDSTALGYIESDETLRAAYCAADLFVLPSLEDNLPNTLLEAMASGTPVLASNIGGMQETICHRENGLLANTGDSRDFAAQLEYAIRNRDVLRTLGTNARAVAESRFSLDTVARTHLSLYSALCDRTNIKSRPLRRSAPVDRALGVEVAGSQGLLDALAALPVMRPASALRPSQWLRDAAKAWAMLRAGEAKRLIAYARRKLAVTRLSFRLRETPASSDAVALGSNFGPVEGPYPDLHLQRIAWLRGRTGELLVAKPSAPATLTVQFQLTRPANVSFRLDDATVTLGAGANFCNPDRLSHEARIEIRSGTGWHRLSINLDCEGAMENCFVLTGFGLEIALSKREAEACSAIRTESK